MAGDRNKFPGLMSEFLVLKEFGNHVNTPRVSYKYNCISKFLWLQMQMEH